MLFLLKLGGSLITDKSQAHTTRADVLVRMASEIAAALRDQPNLRLVIGHGSGSFGHVAGQRHGTRNGVQNREQWLGFADVWKEARALNQIVVEALEAAGLPVIAFPPSAGVIATGGQVSSWDLAPLQAALAAGLVPLINGDAIFDSRLGGTILSTEELFFYMAPRLGADRILLAGIEAGVWRDYPERTALIPTITLQNFERIVQSLGGSAAIDVTGGMAAKVEEMLRLVEHTPGLEVLIFPGKDIARALRGESPGTSIRNS